MSDIIHGTFPRPPGAATPTAIDDAALQRMLNYRDRLAQGEMPTLLAPMLCATLPDIIEELLAHRRSAIALGARHERLTQIEDAAHTAEGLAREACTDTATLQGIARTHAKRFGEIEDAILELAQILGVAPTLTKTREAPHGNHA